MPANGTVCDGDMLPFGIKKEGTSLTVEHASYADNEDKMAWALRELMYLPLGGAFM